jgi:hypothetical protein
MLEDVPTDDAIQAYETASHREREAFEAMLRAMHTRDYDNRRAEWERAMAASDAARQRLVSMFGSLPSQ